MHPRSPDRASLPSLASLALTAAAAGVLFVRYVMPYLGAGGAGHALPGDFGVYLHAWERVSHGASPYVASEYSAFKYSPGFLALLRWLPAAPAKAWVAYGVLSIAAFVFALVAGGRPRSWKSLAGLALGLAIAWKGVIEAFDYGQTELLILGLAAGAAWTFRRAPGLSGFLLGILPGLKLPWGLLALPYFVAARAATRDLPRRRSFLPCWLWGYFLASFFWAAALPSLTFGPERAKALSESWLALLRTQPDALFRSDINQSLWIAAERLGGAGVGSLAALGLACVLAGWLLGRLLCESPRMLGLRGQLASGGEGPAVARVTPWLIFTQLVNPLAWRWGSVYAVAVPFALRGVGRLRATDFVILSLTIALWLLQLNPVVKLLGFSHWTELHAYGLVTAYWLGLLILCLRPEREYGKNQSCAPISI